MSSEALAQITSEIEVLETLDAFASELETFTSTLAQYSGQDPSALTSDPTIAYELGQLKELARNLSSAVSDADDVLGRGPAAASEITSVVQRLDRLADHATRTEALSGAERLRALGDLVENIESVATALTGLGSLNPVIGVFLTLYGTALRSAADTAEFLQTIQDHKVDVISRTDGIGDQAEDAASRQPVQRAPDPAVLEARRKAQIRLEELYAERWRELARRNANDLKRARDHCARAHRKQLEEAALAASRLDFRAHMSGEGMNGDTAAALEEWLATPQPGMEEALAAASFGGDPEVAAEVAARARSVMEIKREVAARMRDYRDCVDEILEHGYQASVVPPAGVGAAAGDRPGSRRLLIGGGIGILAIAAVGIPLLLSGSDPDGEPTGTPTTVTSEVASVDETGVAADDATDGALISPRPEADEPATLTLTGDDACGNMASMQDTPVNLAAGPSGQGGQIRFLGPAGMTPEALTGVLTPGPDGPAWEDVTGTQDGVEDEQVLDGIVVAEGVITGSLTWTDHSGCTAVFEVEYGVPAVLTQWFMGLPPAAPPDSQFSGELTEDSEQLVVTGVLTDLAGAPIAGGEVVVTVLGSDGLAGSYPTVSGPDGSVRLEVEMPPGEPSSVSVQITNGAHGLANLFLQ